jgi:CRISPR system Cascade subunit CasD
VFAARREELAAELETVLTRRDYRADVSFTVALWRRNAPLPWTLADFVDALRRPAFVPYLGRKSCPLGLPMAPLIVEADTVCGSLQRRDAEAPALERDAAANGGGFVWADQPSATCPPLGLDEQHSHVEWRRDELVSRMRWQFGLRAEVAAPWPVA